MQHLHKTGGSLFQAGTCSLSDPFVRSLPRYLFTSLLRAPPLARADFGPAGEGKETDLITVELRVSDYFDDVLRRALLRNQSQDASIHRGEFPLLVQGKPEQVGIGDLLMPHQPPGKWLGGRNQTDFVRPEVMRGMIQVGGEQLQCFWWCHGVARKNGVGNDSYESGFGERAGCPPIARFPA